MILPGWLWLYDHGHYRKGGVVQKVVYLLHWGMILLGLFFLVGATYAVIIQIIDAYATGTIGMWIHIYIALTELTISIGGAFSCADNSNSS